MLNPPERRRRGTMLFVAALLLCGEDVLVYTKHEQVRERNRAILQDRKRKALSVTN